MYWLFTDETNVTNKDGDFFIYGGLVMTGDQMLALNSEVVAIRKKYGYTDGDQFKFQTAARPTQVSVADCTAAKAEALAALEKHGALVMMYVVLHELARNQSVSTMTEWALNSLVAHFDKRFLRERGDVGAVCIDRLDPKVGYAYMKRSFSDGVTLQDDRSVKLDRVIHYSMSCDGASHMSSLTDIALGSMRYAVNYACGKGNEEAARSIMIPLSRAMWAKHHDGTRQVGGYGFLKYPKEIRSARYQERYDALVATLTDLGVSEPADDANHCRLAMPAPLRRKHVRDDHVAQSELRG